MKTSEDVKAFKNELRNYKFYQKQIKKLEEDIQDIYDQLGGVHSPQFDTVPCHSPKNLDREYKLREEIERLEKRKALVELKLSDIERVLGYIKLDCTDEFEYVNEAIIKLYVNRISSEKLQRIYHLAPTTIREHINKAIKKALNF